MSPTTRSKSKNSYKNVDSDDSGDENHSGSSVPMLQTWNYPIWRVKMRNLLLMKGVWSVVETEPPMSTATAATPLTDAQNRENSRNKQMMDRALGCILDNMSASMADAVFRQASAAHTPHAIWTDLSRKNQANKKTQLRDLTMQFNQFAWKGKSVSDNLNKFSLIVGELDLLGQPKGHEDQIQQFVCSAHPAYETTVDSAIEDSSVKTLDDMVNKLRNKELRMRLSKKVFEDQKARDKSQRGNNRNQNGNGNGKGNNKPNKPSKSELKALFCTYCKKKNHEAKVCYKKKRDDNNKKTESANSARDSDSEVALITYESDSDESIPELVSSSEEEEEEEKLWDSDDDDVAANVEIISTENVLAARSLGQRLKPWEFIVDSGASKHMTARRELFDDYEESNNLGDVRAANNHRMAIHGKGSITLVSTLGIVLRLHDVLHVPELEQSLFSVPACTKKGCKVVFSDYEIKISSNNKTVMKGSRMGNLYKLMTKPKATDDKVFESAMVTTRSKTKGPKDSTPTPTQPILTEPVEKAQRRVRFENQPQESQESQERVQNKAPEDVEAPKEVEAPGYVEVPAPKDDDVTNVTHTPKTATSTDIAQKDPESTEDASRSEQARNEAIRKGRELLGTRMEKHRKLCHFHSEEVKAVDCKACIKAKATRTINKRYAEESTFLQGEFLHSDTMQMPVETYSGKKHVVGIVDDYSDRKWAIPIKQKSDTEATIKRTMREIETETGNKCKVFRHDGGGEYISTSFKKWLEDNGTKYQETHTDAPFENGKSERWNRTLLGGIRAVLLDSGLPNKAWGEAANTVCYTHNRIGRGGISPCERYFGTKPALRHLQIFGQRAMVYQLKRNKLQSQAKELVFVGYNGHNTKGYRFLNVHTGNITVSKDATFLKNDMTMDERDPVRVYKSANDSKNKTEMEFAIHADTDPKEKWTGVFEPTSYLEAMKSKHAQQWHEAMEAEIDALVSNGTWTLVDRPKDQKVVRSKWVYKIKLNADGTLNKFKARLVALGYTQVKGIDYDDTFAPVARIESVRTVLAIAVEKGWDIHSMDVNNAYTTSKIDKEIYMEQPAGFCNGLPDSKNKYKNVCLLKKSLYGTKQAGHLFNRDIHAEILKAGLKQSSTDPCVYYNEFTIVCLYVDDLMIIGTGEAIADFKASIKKRYTLTDNGLISEILGIKIQRSKDELALTQSLYIGKILDKFGMNDCKPQDSPMSSTFANEENDVEDDHTIDGESYRYREAIGSLLHLANCTRPDIAYAVNTLSQATANPERKHWTAVKRIIRYLKGTQNIGLKYSKTGSKNQNVLSCYTDASYATGAKGKSISGCLIMLNGNVITWSSRKQTVVAQSTVESEYIALSEASRQVTWIQNMLIELGLELAIPSTIYEDNQGTIKLAENPLISKRSKHIAVRYHYIREKLEEGMISLVYCSTKEMIADALTKPLPKTMFEILRARMGLEMIQNARRGEVLETASASGPSKIETAESYFIEDDFYDYGPAQHMDMAIYSSSAADLNQEAEEETSHVALLNYSIANKVDDHI